MAFTQAPVAGITKREKIEHEIMEACVSGDALTYNEKTIVSFAWRCDSCGLVWQKKWHAERCTEHGHKPHFAQTYHRVVAGQYGQKATQPYEIQRYAIRREQV